MQEVALASRLRWPIDMTYRPRAWNLRESYRLGKGNPMEDPFRGQRPRRGTRVRAADRLEFAPVDVTYIRERFDMPQTQFAQMLGISVETLRNWERGRRHPLGPSRALLRIAAAHPDVVASVLRNARATWSPEEEGSWEPLDLVLKRHRARRAEREAERAIRDVEEAAKASEMRGGDDVPDGTPKTT